MMLGPPVRSETSGPSLCGWLSTQIHSNLIDRSRQHGLVHSAQSKYSLPISWDVVALWRHVSVAEYIYERGDAALHCSNKLRRWYVPICHDPIRMRIHMRMTIGSPSLFPHSHDSSPGNDSGRILAALAMR